MDTIEFTCIDFETIPGEFGPEPAEFGLIRLNTQGVVSQYFECAVPIAKQYAESPFCRDDMLSCWPEVAPALENAVVIGHNIGYDRALLLKLFPSLQVACWVDTLNHARHLLPNMESYALEQLVPELGLQPILDSFQQLTPHMEPHRALYDSAAAAILAIYLHRLPGGPDLLPPQKGLFD